MDMDEKNQNLETQETEEQPDAITLLAERLGAIESALGVGGSKPSESNLLGRLDKIEQGIFKTERERNLPQTITPSEASSLSFLRKNGIQLEDFSTGRIRIEG